MNWLDIVLLAVLAIGALVGMRIGLIGAAITAAAIFIGWLLASQWSDDLGSLFADSLSNETLVTVVAYAIIIIATIVVAVVMKKVVRPLLAVLTLELSSMVERLGGAALGLVFGAAIAGALIIGMARFTYNFDMESLVTENIPSQVPGQVISLYSQVEDTRGTIEDVLTNSFLVPVFIDVTNALPADAFGFVPSDFKVALDILEERIQE